MPLIIALFQLNFKDWLDLTTLSKFIINTFPFPFAELLFKAVDA